VQASVCGSHHWLSTQEYVDGTVHPDGYRHLVGFELIGSRPRWTWQIEGQQLTCELWMPYGVNQTVIRFRTTGSSPVDLQWQPLVALRWFHQLLTGKRVVDVGHVPDAMTIVASGNAPSLTVGFEGWSFDEDHAWHLNLARAIERERGFDFQEDVFVPGTFHTTIRPGDDATLVLAAGQQSDVKATSREPLAVDRQAAALVAGVDDELEAQLRLAADQFLVRRGGIAQGMQPNTVIAGYPWFGDWGRDTFIALPGLCLATGRDQIARSILISYARYVDQGMVPNRWPDAGHEPEYHSVDAALWFLYALEAYVTATGDTSILEGLGTAIVDIVHWHVGGTRHGIQVDPSDGLLTAGAEDLQLTWMDAKIGEWVVTPRRGKPVEINALWWRGLTFAVRAIEALQWDASEMRERARQTAESFNLRFRNPDSGGLFDVVDGPGGNDAAVRPNQIIALAVAPDLFPADLMQSVLALVERELLTPFGLRSLSPADPAYHPHYGGAPVQRDGAYHQGPVWSWLLGMYVRAAVAAGRTRRDLAWIESGLARHLRDGAIGTVGELFQPDPPYVSEGAFAQAWGVAEWLWAVQTLRRVYP
jgi:predicted glycogen debranching enzyme